VAGGGNLGYAGLRLIQVAVDNGDGGPFGGKKR
jgi:hypothetical protein